MSTIPDVLSGKPVKILKVICTKKISNTIFVITAGKKNAILDTPDCPDLNEGMEIRILKPQKVNDDTILTKVKPLVMKKSVSIKDVDKEDICRLAGIAEKHKIGATFTIIKETVGEEGIISNFIAMIVNISREQVGTYGKYQITGMKDVEGVDASIILSTKHLNMLEVGKVYHFEKLKKKSNQVDNDTVRFGCSMHTKIKEASEDDRKYFKDIKIGDGIANGEVIMIVDCSISKICPEHKSKLLDGKCPGQGESVKNPIIDFMFKLFIEDANDGDVEICVTRRGLQRISVDKTDTNESFQTKVTDFLLDKQVRVHFNMSEDTNTRFAALIEVLEDKSDSKMIVKIEKNPEEDSSGSESNW